MRLNIVPSRHSVRLENGMYETRMKDSIIINYTPKGEFDLISKGLADHYIDRIDLNRLETIFSKNLFPNYKGHFDKINNEWYFNHTTKGKSNDAYMTVDKRGFVTKSQRKLPANLIDKFGFEKINRDSLPNIVEGLGIKNAVNLKGNGVVKGGLIYKDMSERPDAPLTTAKTRKFLNSKEIYEIGDIIMVRANVDMSNTSFLKLDGRQYRVSEYEKLFKYLGPSYGLNTSRYHRGQPWKETRGVGDNPNVYWDFKPTIKTVYYSEFHNLGGAAIFLTKDKIYVCGGYRGDRSKPLKSVYIAHLDKNGEISKITRGSDLPEARVFSRAIAFCGFIYIIGGSPRPNAKVGGSNIIKAKINDDGSLGPWTLGEKLPYEYSRSFPYLTGNRLYIIGGIEFSHNDGNKTIERTITKESWCFINPDGTLRLPWKFSDNPDFETYDGVMLKEHGGITMIRSYPNIKNVTGLALYNHINFRSTPRWTTGIWNFNGTYTVPSVSVKMRTGFSYFVFGVNQPNHSVYGKSKSFMGIMYKTIPGGGFTNKHDATVPLPNDNVYRNFHDCVQTNQGPLFIGGVSNLDPRVNAESNTSPKCVYIKINTGTQDYIKWMKEDKNPKFFNVPLIDDTAFNGEVYSYYIKAK